MTNIGLEWGVTGVLGATLAWVSVQDWRSFTIPDTASLGLIVLGLGLSPFSTLTTPTDAALGALFGFGVFAVIGEIYFRMRGADALGLGDAKLLGAAGAWLGWAALPGLVAFASLSAMCFALISGQRRLAFGPWLALAFWILWLVGQRRL